ncbi:MAG: dipeptidase PepE [Prevotellaceae bacterium]|jgi:dipeptidase E|nr:dipeptidase PepE [Prevotellaceae bacterium]
MRLLLISNSTNPGEAYLDYPKEQIRAFLEKNKVNKVLFIPYAAVTFSYDEYVAKVQERFDEFGVKVEGIHRCREFPSAVERAEAIVVGGGNTFHLLKYVQAAGIVEGIRRKVAAGTPYLGWSAGANLACPTICTTNDMPIVQPQSFEALNLIPFQINPHYLDVHPEGFAGETREQRIKEYIAANPRRYVAGLRESCMLIVEGNRMELIGPKSMRVFKNRLIPAELEAGDLSDFLETTRRQEESEAAEL